MSDDIDIQARLDALTARIDALTEEIQAEPEPEPSPTRTFADALGDAQSKWISFDSGARNDG